MWLVTDIDWTILEHAYGSAEDVPEMLEACRTDPEGPWDAAGALIHQGSLYTATPVAMPLLAALALDPDCASRVEICQVVSYFALQVARGTAVRGTHSVLTGPAFDAQFRAAVDECMTALRPLADATDQKLVSAALGALSWSQYQDEQLVATLKSLATSCPDTEGRLAAIFGLGRQGRLDDLLCEMILREDGKLYRLAVCWVRVVVNGDYEQRWLQGLADNWNARADKWAAWDQLRGIALIDDPADELSSLTNPWPVIDALLNSPEATKAAVEVMSNIADTRPELRSEIISRATLLAQRNDLVAPGPVADLLDTLGRHEDATAVRIKAIPPGSGRLNGAQLSALVGLIHSGADPRQWEPQLLSHLASDDTALFDFFQAPGMYVSLDSFLDEVPFSPELLSEFRRHLAAAIAQAEGERTTQTPGSVSPVKCEPRIEPLVSVIGHWGLLAKPAIPELIAAIPYATNVAAYALAECDAKEAVEPLSAAFDTCDDPTWLALKLVKLTGDGNWAERVINSGNPHPWSLEQLLRAWADHPTAGLAPACRNLVTGQAEPSYSGRDAQLAAIEILHRLGDDTHVTDTLQAIIDAGGPTATEAEELADRLRLDAVRDHLAEMEAANDPTDPAAVAEIMDWLAQ